MAVAVVYGETRRPPAADVAEAVLSWPGDAEDPEAEAVQIRVKGPESRSLSISLGGDLAVEIAVEDGKVTLSTGAVEVALQRGGDSDGVVRIGAGGSEVRVEQDGAVRVVAATDLKLEGANVAIEASGSVTVNGQSVELN